MSQDSRHGLAGTEVTDNAGKRGRGELTPGRYTLHGWVRVSGIYFLSRSFLHCASAG